jgi:hypothetical protein
LKINSSSTCSDLYERATNDGFHLLACLLKVSMLMCILLRYLSLLSKDGIRGDLYLPKVICISLHISKLTRKTRAFQDYQHNKGPQWVGEICLFYSQSFGINICVSSQTS